MPVIPFSSAPRAASLAGEAVERDAEAEAKRYREESDAKLRRLMAKGVKAFDPRGGTPMIDIPERVQGGFRVNPPGVETPNPYLESGTPDMRGFVPAEGSPLWDQFEQDRMRKAQPGEVATWEGGNSPMGAGGPDNPVNNPAITAAVNAQAQDGVAGLSAQDIADLKEWRRKRDEERADSQMRQTMGALDRSPEEVAKALELANKTGANRLEVQENLKSFQQSDAMSRIEGLRKSAPKLRTWLDDPVNLELAHDDTDNLSWWGTPTFEEFGGALKSGVQDKVPEQFFGMAQMGMEINQNLFGWIPGFGAANARGIEDVRTERRNAALRALVNSPQGDTWFERGLYGAAQSAPATVTSAITTVITKSPAAGAGSMGAMTAGGAFGEAEDAGKPFIDRLRYAFTQGGIEAATEMVPLKFLVGDLAKDTPFAQAFFKQALSEGISEQAATFLQDASTWLELHPEKSIGEFFAERPNAALETLVASSVMSGVQTTVAYGAQAALETASQSVAQKRSEDLARFIQAMGDSAKDSKLLKRLPEKYREAVASITKDGPIENIRVQSEAFTELAQTTGVGVDQLAKVFNVDADAVAASIANGEDIVIPSGNYAAALQTAKKDIGITGEAIHSAFAPNIRLRADEFTAKEHAAMKQVFEAEQEARKRAAETDQSFADSADRVREAIREQVVATGMYSTDVANQQAELVGAIVTTLAERTGQDPETLWKEQGFDIVASVRGEEDPVALAQTSINELANPRGFITGKDKTGARKTYTPRDIVLGYNDGDSTLDIALDLDISEDADQRAMVRDAAARIRSNVRRAIEEGQLQRLAEAWKVTPDELQKFASPSRPGAKGGAFEDLMNDVADIVERDNRNGHAPGLEQVASRLAARGFTISPSTLKVRLSNARTGNGDGVLSDKTRERIRALQFARGRGAAQGKALAQGKTETGGTFTPREDRSIVRLFEKRNFATLAHEASHWYLDTLWRMGQTENPHPFVLEQLASILEWHGKSPNWTAMFNPDGSFTQEGVDMQEAFAETFEAYLREGKAPSVGMRAVFAAFKQWLIRAYKAVTAIGQRVNLNDEIRQVFDRMVASDEAIRAAQSNLTRDSEAMAKALLDKGVITPKQFEKTKERIQAARERAEAALMARLMDEYERNQKAWWNEEERQTRREVASEIDERPEQRAYQVLAGVGWRDTREAHAEAAFTEAQQMRALAHAPELGYYDENATTESIMALQARMVENGIIPIVLLFRTTSGRIIAFPGDSGSFGMHHDMAREVFGLGDLKLQHGVWNPRRWPTLEAMNEASTAWYDTTGTQADERVSELAQRTVAADRHAADVKRVADFLRANPAMANAALSAIMTETQTAAYAADKGRRLYRKETASAQSLAQISDGGVAALRAFIESPDQSAQLAIDNYEVELRKSLRADETGQTIEMLDLVSITRTDAENASFTTGRSPDEKPGDFRDLMKRMESEAASHGIGAVYVESVMNEFLPEVLTRYGYAELGSGEFPSFVKHVPMSVDATQQTWTSYALEAEAAGSLAQTVNSFRGLRNAPSEELSAWFDAQVKVTQARGSTVLKVPFEDGTGREDIQIFVKPIQRPDYSGVSVDMMFEGRLAAVEDSTQQSARQAQVVFAKTVAALQVHIQRTQPDFVTFTGSGVAQEKLYDFMVRKFSFGGYEGRVETFATARILGSANRVESIKVFHLVRPDLATQIPIDLEVPRVTEDRLAGLTEKNLRYFEIVQPAVRAGSSADAGGSQGRGTDAGGNAGTSLAQTVSLAQSQTHDPAGARELDALGFYSAVFEAAKSVRPDVWNMGWNHARNSIVKGGAKINGQRVAPRESEMAYLGLDEMFYGTKLKGAELAEAVLSHIQAKRLMLVQNFARFDPNVKTPTKAAMLDQLSDDDLASMLGVSEIPLQDYNNFRVVASELDGANEFHTGLFIKLAKDQPPPQPLSGAKSFVLERVLDDGKREVIAQDYMPELLGQASRIILNENRAKVMRKISAETLAEYWNSSRTDISARTLVRGPGDIRLPGEDVPLYEMVIGLPPGVPGSDYRAPASHIGGKMQGTLVTAHGEERIDDKGQRTVFVGQVQSDMAQNVRALKEEANLPEREAKVKARQQELDQLLAARKGEETTFEERLKLASTPDWWPPVKMARAMLAQAQEELARAKNLVENWDAPLLKTSEWTNVAVRAMLYRAAREGFQSISFPTAETSEIIQGNDDAAQHYETNVKGALEKIAKQLGGEVRKGAVKYNPLSQPEWENLPPETAEAVLASLWSRLPPAVRGTLRRDLPKMRKTDGGEFYVASRYRANDDDSHVSESHFAYTMQREAKNNPLIAAYQIWVQGAMIFGEPGAFERLIVAAGGPQGAVSEALQQAIAEGEPASAYILDITPEMRRKIVTEGFPLFHTRTGRPATTTPPTSIPPMRLNLQAVLEQYGEKALADLPPEVAAYAMQASDVEQFVELARNVRKSLGKKHPKSLWKFLSTSRQIGSGNDKISYRGIRDDGGELIKIIGEKKAAPGLISEKTDAKNVRSYTIEHAAQAAWEEGYFNGESPPGPAEFLDALRADLDGSAKLYSRDDMATVAEIKNAEEWASWFDQNDVDIRAPVAELREKLAIVATSQGSSAISPDEAAPFFKMRDGAELLEGLKQGPLRDKLIREETQRRMIERHGDIFKTGKVMEEAQVYARNEIQHRQFEIELDALAQATGQQAASNLAKQQAIENLRSKQVREVLNYNQWLVLERRWAQKAVEAAGKGNMAKAQEYARYRLINSHMYTEGKKLAERIEKTRKHLLAYDSKTKLARLYAAGKDYADQMKGLLSDYQLRNESKKAEDRRASRAVWLQAQMAGIDPFAAYGDPTKTPQEKQVAAAEAIERSTMLARLAEGVDATNYKSVTVEELEAVRDEADLIWKLATLKDRLIKEGERRRLSLAGDDIAAEVEANQPNPKPPEPIETDTPGAKLKAGPKQYFAMHRTLQSLAHQFAGGKSGGVFWRYIVRPLNEAFSRLSSLRKEMGGDVAKLFSVYTKAERERFYRDRRHFKGINRSLTTQGRLAIALNWGNAKNRKRIMDAYGWNEAQVQEVLDSLDKRDWDFVQSVWDYMNQWFPEANRVHEAVHGVPMTKEDPIQVATRFGVYAGGYYPIKFDPMLSSKAGQRAVEAEAKKQTGRVGVRTKEGFTKKRVEGKVTMPLRLSALDVISQHLDEVAKSIATEETLFDVGRILKQPQVEDAIVSRHGRQIYNTIINQVVTAKFGMEGTSGLLAHLRNGATVVGLSWKVATASLQILGVSNSIVRVGSTWMARGYAKMGKDAASLESSARLIMEKSEFMRHRREQQSPEMASLLDAMKTKWTPDFIARVIPRELRGAHNWFVKNGFALMANVQFYSVDMPTWYGAYLKAQNDGASEADAVAMADQAVIDAQGGGELHQLAAMQSGAGTKYAALLRVLTNFMSYMVTTYNLGVQRVRNARTTAQIAALALDFVLLAVVPVAGKMLIDALTRGVGADDEPEEWAERYAREQLAFVFGPFLGVSQFAGSVRGDDAFGYSGPAGFAIFNEMNKLGAAVSEGKFIDEEEGGLDPAFWRPANRALGMVFHYPAGQIDASVRGALAYFNGETNNPAAFFFGPAPAN